MNSFVIGSRSYQPHISRRRSSVVSSTSVGSLDSAPSSPLEAAATLPPVISAIRYTYVCNECGFGTDLLSKYMPHASNPCDAPAPVTWNKP
ncbi:hypothetical protein LPJ73_004362 [Coemansia sp. RSA 2703]|nr:hypothetical protein LPJ73_004362 [Coemansia sp. RSA 2703]KAJ2361302.1 hypothetical protein IW150_007275 [Coemansia sp. RSA 2607]KAJ2396800.1 hypothetical protein GGI05_000955 [Coemansia sp. RSA 2603]